MKHAMVNQMSELVLCGGRRTIGENRGQTYIPKKTRLPAWAAPPYLALLRSITNCNGATFIKW